MSVDAWFPTGRGDAPLERLDLAGGESSINQRQLRRHGLAGWQATTTAALLATWELSPKPGVFFDVGANAGVYALLCRLLWSSIDVIAFEASPATVAAGRRWADANGIQVRFEQLAVSDTEGRGCLYLSGRSDASNSLVHGFRRSAGTLEVDLVTLDRYVATQGVAPTVVKIDVEQHEPAVVRGAHGTLAAHRPVIVMELLRSDASRDARRQLRRLGYEEHALGARDRIYFPDSPPTDWRACFAEWLRAVERCTPPAPAVHRRLAARIRWKRRPHRPTR